MITWLKRKYRVRKPTQQGYTRPADNGDSGNKKRKKLNDKAKAALPPQRQRMMIMTGDGRRRMISL